MIKSMTQMYSVYFSVKTLLLHNGQGSKYLILWRGGSDLPAAPAGGSYWFPKPANVTWSLGLNREKNCFVPGRDGKSCWLLQAEADKLLAEAYSTSAYANSRCDRGDGRYIGTQTVIKW